MGAGVNLFLYLSVNVSNILSPIVIGAQLSVPLAIILTSVFIGELISYKKWILLSEFGQKYFMKLIYLISRGFFGGPGLF